MMKKRSACNYSLMIIGVMFFFTTSCKKEESVITVKDIDGNEYKTVKIGKQLWMAENLKTAKYRNGDPIPNIISNREWLDTKTGACCDYGNTPSNSETYGKLYNYYAVEDSRNLCPMGWHVPTDAEWTTLTNYLGDKNMVGYKLRSSSSLWVNTYCYDSNSSGFSALPGGSRSILNGNYQYIGEYTTWWSSTKFDNYSAWFRTVASDYNFVYSSNLGFTHGFSVRCIKD